MVETSQSPDLQLRPQEEVEKISQSFNQLSQLVTKAKVDTSEIPEEAKAIAKSIIEEYKVAPQELAEIIRDADNPHSVFSRIKKEDSDVYETVELNPHKMTVIPAQQDELVAANLNINFSKISDEYTKKLFTGAVRSLRTYLRGNYIKDGFSDPDHRKAWELGTKDVLEFLDLQNPDGNQKKDEGYAETFKRNWDENKYSKNYRAKFRTAMTLLGSAINQKEKPVYEISKEAQDSLRANIAASELLGHTPNIGKEEVYELTKVGNTVAKETLEILSKELSWQPQYNLVLENSD